MSSPLAHYRRAQRLARREFDAFTRVHCPTCPHPCCVKPARITPLDLVLAAEAGWRPPEHVVSRADWAKAASAAHYLGEQVSEEATEPCDFLGPRGCTFPDDLRPCGCTLFLCDIMRERLDRKRLGRLKRAVNEVRQAHEALVAHLARSGASPSGEA
jgi:hypothetical protein